MVKKFIYSKILIKINILYNGGVNYLKRLEERSKENNCMPLYKYIPLSINEKYHNLIRFFEENQLY